MKKRDAFSGLHPAVEMLFFIYVLLITMLIMHPVVLAVSFLSSFIYAVYLSGAKAVRFQLLGVLPIMLFTAILNPIFNHAGVTTLFYMSNGNPITKEAICFGIAAAAMFASVIVWFSCYNKVMTSDKFIYLFGRIIPALSLIISMALRFVPRFVQKIKETANAQKCIGRDPESGNIFKRALCGLRILSITVTWALESAVTTADSMKSRGYGLRGRTAYSIYKFDKRDKLMLAFMIITGGLFCADILSGGVFVRYYPSIRLNSMDWMSVLGYASFAVFCNLPMILNFTEDMVWKSLQSKI